MGAGQVTALIHPLNNMGTKIYNSQLTAELREGAKIMTSVDATPSEIAEKVIPVMEVNPKFFRKVNGVVSVLLSATGSGTILANSTIAPLKKFVLTGFTYQIVKDVVCDVATGTITATLIQDGQTKTFLAVPVITLTAQQFSGEVTLNPPIETDMGTNISWASKAFTAGVMQRNITIYGYYIDTPSV